MKKLLLYLTNNEKVNKEEEIRQEVMFDVIFLFIITVALLVGAVILAAKSAVEWIPFLVIEYAWCLDNIRHNRP